MDSTSFIFYEEKSASPWLIVLHMPLICFLEIEHTRGVVGVKDSIVAFQAVDPGSIPGGRTLLLTSRGRQSGKCGRSAEDLRVQGKISGVCGVQ